MISTSIFGVVVIAVNVFFVVDTLITSFSNIHWAIILLVAIIGVAYFAFVIYLVSLVQNNLFYLTKYLHRI